MTRRLGLVLLYIAGGHTLLPGCSPLQQSRLPARREAAHPETSAPTTQPARTLPQEPLVPPRQAPVTTQTVQRRANNEAPRPSEPQAGLGNIEEEPVAPTPGSTRPTTLPVPPDKPAPPLVEALRCMLEKRHQDALRYLQSYDQQTQEFLLQFLPALIVFHNKCFAELGPQEIAVLYDNLQAMQTSLRPYTELGIGRLCFCREATGYGSYEALPADYAFPAAASDRPGESGGLVQLYFELRNFASEPRDGHFETILSSAVEIRDSQGNLRKRFPVNRSPYKTTTRLHDYWNIYSFCVPAELEPGTYELTLQVVDETVPVQHRVARQSIEFRLSAAPGRN
jgi:hypothetical protein